MGFVCACNSTRISSGKPDQCPTFDQLYTQVGCDNGAAGCMLNVTVARSRSSQDAATGCSPLPPAAAGCRVRSESFAEPGGREHVDRCGSERRAGRVLGRGSGGRGGSGGHRRRVAGSNGPSPCYCLP